jgi:thiamine-phosphate pyrophosphorylase
MFAIIVITPEINHPKEVAILNALVRDYHCTIHIRKPQFDIDSYKQYLEAIKNILPNCVLHEHHSLEKEFAVKGIHLKERDRNNPNTIDSNTKIISTSIHSIEDARKLSHPFEYIFYSPLFESISKNHYGSNSSIETLQNNRIALKKITAIPIIGLGGIHAGNIARVKECGFDGAAVLGAVWESEDPIVAFEKVISFKC